MPPSENDQLIQTYFRMVEKENYAGIGSILTEDATWTIVLVLDSGCLLNGSRGNA